MSSRAPGPHAARLDYDEGLALEARGDSAGALAAYRRAVAVDPRHAKAQNNLGRLLHMQGDRIAAMQCYARALEANADLMDAHRNLAITCMETADWAQAERHARRAVELEPGSVEPRGLLAHVLVNRGLELQERRDWAQAIACFRQALEHDPRLPEAHVCLGSVLEASSDSPEAIEHYRAAIAISPDLAQAHFNYALQLLKQENFAQGWDEYEWRWRLPELAGFLPTFTAPPWDGSALLGKTVLLYTEQGFGDALQFVRYAPLLAQAGARVAVHCPPSLKRLFAIVPGVSVALSDPDPLPACDYSCPLMSLPRLLRHTYRGILAEVPYLRPDGAALEHFRQRMRDQETSLKVGLVWASHSAKPSLARLKSFSLAALAPLASVPGVTFFSLQTGESAGDARQAPPGMALVDLRAELGDFLDTAAAIARLDLVITVDTAVAHLAGAMAAPVWTLVPFPPDWRWHRHGERCAWYPTMRLFRQKHAYEWGDTILEVAQALAERARRR